MWALSVSMFTETHLTCKSNNFPRNPNKIFSYKNYKIFVSFGFQGWHEGQFLNPRSSSVEHGGQDVSCPYVCYVRPEFRSRPADPQYLLTICVTSLNSSRQTQGQYTKQEVLGRTNSPTFPTYIIYLKYLNLI
jgi:hypothetical protein